MQNIYNIEKENINNIIFPSLEQKNNNIPKKEENNEKEQDIHYTRNQNYKKYFINEKQNKKDGILKEEVNKIIGKKSFH